VNIFLSQCKFLCYYFFCWGCALKNTAIDALHSISFAGWNAMPTTRLSLWTT
jgi:hypothetical protein